MPSWVYRAVRGLSVRQTLSALTAWVRPAPPTPQPGGVLRGAPEDASAQRDADPPTAAPAVRPAAGTRDERACDCDALIARLDGDVTLAREMARAFVSDARRLVDGVAAAARSGEAESLRRAAHALKGAAGNFDATETVALAAELERIGRAGDLTSALPLVERLEAAAARLVSTLQTFGGSEACAS